MTDRPPVMRMVRIMAVITVKIPEIKVARRLKMLRKRTTGIMGPRRPQP